MAKSLELDVPESAPCRTFAGWLLKSLLQTIGCEPGRITAFDAVRVTLSLVLLMAAGLKGHQLATSPSAGSAMLASRWLLIALVGFEFSLGIWLLSGTYACAARNVSIGCFVAFSMVSLRSALRGDASCGCFGAVDFRPWVTASLDIAATAAFVAFKPAAWRAKLSAAYFRLIVAAVIFVGGSVAIINSRHGLAVLAPDSPPRIELGTCSRNPHAVINIGSVGAFEIARTTLVLTNCGADEILIDRFVSTCECTSVEGLPVSVPPHSRKEISIASDWSRDPAFAGRLAIAIKLFSGRKLNGFVTVRATVINKAKPS